jgi:hypothetical protein
MPQFKEKPAFVEAHAWDGTIAGAQALMEFVGGGVLNTENVDEQGVQTGEILLFMVPTIRGDRAPVEGSWIVRAENGNIEMLKPEQFAAMYEPV